MILNAEKVMLGVSNPFVGVVVEVNVSLFHLWGKRIRIDREAVILSCDFDVAGKFVQDGLVGSAMAES